MVEAISKSGQIIPSDEAIKFAASLLEIPFEKARVILIGEAVQKLSDQADKMLEGFGLNHEEKVNPPASS